jgi:hypothetical protein
MADPRVAHREKGGWFPGTCFISRSSIFLMMGSLCRVVGSSIGGEVISLSSSPTTSPDKESRVDPRDGGHTVLSAGRHHRCSDYRWLPRGVHKASWCWPHPDCVILCRRVVVSLPHLSCAAYGSGSLTLRLLALAELWGRQEASRSVVRMSGSRITGFQARLTTVEVRASKATRPTLHHPIP